MGGTSSTAADTIDTDVTETKNQNYGLLNISNESLNGGINIVEIITFVLVLMGAFVFLKTVCARRRKKRLDEMHAHLQGISIPDYPPQPPVVRVQPNAAHVPFMAAQPPVYPGSQIATMEKYDI